MRNSIIQIIAALIVGFAAGGYFSGWWSLQEWEKSNVGETLYYLEMANNIRNGMDEKVVEHYESMIEIHVLGFARSGENVKSLSENDLCVLDKVMEYWEEKCQRKCFSRIEVILNQRDLRITSACSRTGVPPAADA